MGCPSFPPPVSRRRRTGKGKRDRVTLREVCSPRDNKRPSHLVAREPIRANRPMTRRVIRVRVTRCECLALDPPGNQRGCSHKHKGRSAHEIFCSLFAGLSSFLNGECVMAYIARTGSTISIFCVMARNPGHFRKEIEHSDTFYPEIRLGRHLREGKIRSDTIT